MQENPNSNLDVIPIETRIRTLDPICSGLYPHEVLILSYINRFTTAHKNYQGFWKYKYGINDMASQVQSLQERGYATIAPLEDIMKNSTVQYLKLLLKKYELNYARKKNDIIRCLIENVPVSQLEQHFPEKNYALTNIGTDILEKESYIPYIHKHNISDLDIWNLSKIIHQNPPMPFKQAIWNYLNNQCEEYHRDTQYGLYRNCKFHMAELLIEENLFDGALNLLFEIIYYDLCDFDNSQSDNNMSQLFPYNHSVAFVAKGILSRVEHCKKELHISDCELKEKMTALLSAQSALQFAPQIFTLEECVDILLYQLNKNEGEIENIYRAAEERYKNSHPEQYDSMKKTHAYTENIRNTLKDEAITEDSIYDPEWEKEIEKRLSKLDELSRKEFYRKRRERDDNEDILSSKKLDRLTLEAMERSFHYHNN